MSALETVTEDSPARQTADDLPNLRGSRSGAAPNSDFERQWLDDYLAGDDSGFISFYHRYRGQLYRYLLAHMPVDTANRLFVQSWLDFIAHCRDIAHDITPGAAVFAEAHRLVLEGYRAQDKSLLLSFADGVVETAGEVPASGFIDHPDLQQTRLTSLPPAWREALQIYLETGFDGDSLAHALHISRDTARSRLKRAFSMWRKQWPDGDNGVEDTLLRSTQHWIFRYRSLATSEPPDYLDARILRQADWHNHWLPRLGNNLERYWHFGLTALVTALGVFGFLWTNSAAPDYTLELNQPAPAAQLEIASPVAAQAVVTAPLVPPVASAPQASAAQASDTSASAAAVSPAPPATPAATGEDEQANKAAAQKAAADKAAADKAAADKRAASAAQNKAAEARASESQAAGQRPGKDAPASQASSNDAHPATTPARTSDSPAASSSHSAAPADNPPASAPASAAEPLPSTSPSPAQ